MRGVIARKKMPEEFTIEDFLEEKEQPVA